ILQVLAYCLIARLESVVGVRGFSISARLRPATRLTEITEMRWVGTWALAPAALARRRWLRPRRAPPRRAERPPRLQQINEHEPVRYDDRARLGSKIRIDGLRRRLMTVACAKRRPGPAEAANARCRHAEVVSDEI